MKQLTYQYGLTYLVFFNSAVKLLTDTKLVGIQMKLYQHDLVRYIKIKRPTTSIRLILAVHVSECFEKLINLYVLTFHLLKKLLLLQKCLYRKLIRIKK